MISYMSYITYSFLIFGCFVVASGQNTLNGRSTDQRHHIQNEKVITLLQKQVGEEIHASLTYLAMAAHFGGEKKNRPGFAKFFQDCAQEEFGHAQKFIEYMNKRGVPLAAKYLETKSPSTIIWDNGYEALKDALNLEGKVTDMIENIHTEGQDDGHLTNFLESEFLEEQVDAMRQLSGYVHNLRSMAVLPSAEGGSKYNYDMLSEYLFDLQLQGKKLEL